jgi:sporulation protein YlmC with PRC-barrel domain
MIGGHPRSTLIESDSVEGRTVFDAQARPLGTVKRLVIHKESGIVLYAVVASRGFLGFGERLYVLPWEELSYSPDLGGFRLGEDVADLVVVSARVHRRHPDWTDREDEVASRLHGDRPHQALLHGTWFI